MTQPAIPLARPWITEAEIAAVSDVLRGGRLSLGPKLEAFETAFARCCATKHAVACSSGTAGLHMLMIACGIEAGDEVITTPFSFVASANCILMQGGRPVFVDIDSESWNIDVAAIEERITERTKAIIAVDVFGQPPDMTAICALARRHDLRVIEDSCEALGSRFHGKPAGALGDAGVFGFYPNKQITTGEGGMVVTEDEAIANQCKSLRNQGRDTNGGWLAHPRMGYNYRLSDIACALGIVQLERLDEIVATRKRVAGWYQERLHDESRIRLQRVDPNVDMSWFVFVVRLTDSYNESDRNRILQGLTEHGIGCSNYFVPIHLQPFFRERFGFAPGDFPHCEDTAARTIALPFHHELHESDVDRVCDELRRLL